MMSTPSQVKEAILIGIMCAFGVFIMLSPFSVGPLINHESSWVKEFNPETRQYEKVPGPIEGRIFAFIAFAVVPMTGMMFIVPLLYLSIPSGTHKFFEFIFRR